MPPYIAPTLTDLPSTLLKESQEDLGCVLRRATNRLLGMRSLVGTRQRAHHVEHHLRGSSASEADDIPNLRHCLRAFIFGVSLHPLEKSTHAGEDIQMWSIAVNVRNNVGL